MKNTFIYFAILSLFFVSCNSDKETDMNTENTLQKSLLTEKREPGSIPSDAIINKVTSGEMHPNTFSDFFELYKKDTKYSAGTDYETNLKNIWLISLYQMILKGEATPEQEKFIIYDQLELEHNLPHLGNFFQLLSDTKSIDKIEKDRITEVFTENNQKAIDRIKWHSPEEKNEKQQELIQSQRIVWLSQQSK